MRLSPIATGVGAGLLLALILAPATGTALGNLAAARAEQANLRAKRDSPVRVAAPLVAPDQAVRAPAVGAARRLLADRIRAEAARGGVLVESIGAVAAPPSLAIVRIRVSGSEKAVVGLADQLERRAPLLRMRNWRIEPVEDGVRLSTEAVSPWQ